MLALDLYDWYLRLTAAKIRAMRGQAQEGRLLDFKTVRSEDFSSGDDKKTLAESLSGFANSEGGVVIWGVDARKDPRSAIDVVVATPGIKRSGLMLSRLMELTPQCASPAVRGVDHRILQTNKGNSFVASFIPQGDGPVMAKAGSDRYFIRSAGSFVRMEHFQLADLFARRNKPKLALSVGSQGLGTIMPTVLLGVTNKGAVSATAPYIYFKVKDPYQRFDMGMDGNGRNMLPYAGRHPGRKDWHMHVSDTTNVIHPSMTAWIGAAFTGYGKAHSTAMGPCEIEYRVGALDASPLAGTVSIDMFSGKSVENSFEPSGDDGIW